MSQPLLPIGMNTPTCIAFSPAKQNHPGGRKSNANSPDLNRVISV